MLRQSRILKTVALAMGLSLLAPISAMAQATPNAAILVVDFQRLVDDSLAGKDAKAQIADYMAKVKAREQQLKDKLVTDAENLQKQRSILKEEDFNRRAVEFDQSRQRAATELENKQVTAQRAARQAESEILRLARPIVRNLMQKRKANMVIPKNVAFDMKESLDVTTKVLEELNREVPKLKVALPET
ncbi:MAG: OmpH family outer membrane protein [Sphingomonadales bacterium]